MEWFPLGQVLPPTRYDRKEEGSRLSSFVFRVQYSTRYVLYRTVSTTTGSSVWCMEFGDPVVMHCQSMCLP